MLLLQIKEYAFYLRKFLPINLVCSDFKNRTTIMLFSAVKCMKKMFTYLKNLWKPKRDHENERVYWIFDIRAGFAVRDTAVSKKTNVCLLRNNF
jgi:hypothetical protein